MANYILRKGKFSNEIAKFEESNHPIDVYRVSERKCDCPSRYRACKHVKIFKTWQYFVFSFRCGNSKLI